MSLNAAELPRNVVAVEGGTIEGVATSNPGVRVFKGIPYAAPPVGELRWKEPQPVVKWTGTRKADQFGPRCTQPKVSAYMMFRDSGNSEDCLYLNVWTPAKSASDKLPVIFWIHGGSFLSGASSEPQHDGEVLATWGVIVVSINYRLGIFGFFAHPDLTKESAITRPATTVCWTNGRRCVGSATISERLAEIRTGSRYLVSPRVRSA